jgi:hypothetical protein
MTAPELERAARAKEKEWRASTKLAASGFRDLEGRDRDGPLSDRGNLHVVTEGQSQNERLAERVEHGSAYHTWALDVARTHRFASPLERDAWASHAAGDGIRETARKLGVNFHRARDALHAVRRALRHNKQKRKHEWDESKIRQLVRRSDPTTLARLAALLIQARPA